MFFKLLNKVKKNRSSLILFIIVLIPVVTLSYFLLYENYQYRHQEEIRKNEQIAQVLAQNLDNYIEHIKLSLIGMGSLNVIKNGDIEEIDKLFKSLHTTENEISLYWITDTEGNVLAKFPNKGSNKSAADKDFFRISMKGEAYVSDRITGEMTGMEIILISVPYRDNKGHIVGVLGASIPLERLKSKLGIKIGQSGYPILVSNSGTFLVHPMFREVRKKVEKNDIIWQALKKGDSGTLDVVAPFDGKRKFFSYVPLRQAPWEVIVIQPLGEFETQLKQLFTRNGLIIFLVFILILLSERYLVLTRNREEEERIQQAEKLALVGELAAGMAHEIRNPLTSIKGFVQLIAIQKDNKAPSEYLETIITEIQRIEEIISETLLLAKPTPTQFVPVDLSKTLQEVYTIMYPQVMLNNINLIISCDLLLPKLQAEPNHLKQVFVNLIKNSIEAMTETGGEIKINVKQQAKYFLITLTDNGNGIPDDILEKIGSPFFSTKDNGTGLGLVVTYRIIQNHGGTIEVFSTKGKGTTFQIMLPLKEV